MFYESKRTFEPLKKWRSLALYHLFTLRLSDALMTPLRQLKNQKIYSQLSLSPISRFMFLLLWNIEENVGFFSIWLAARKLEPCQLMDAVFWWRFPRQKYGKLESKITGNKRHRQKKMSSSNIFTPNLILHPMKNENDDMIWKPTFLGKIRCPNIQSAK